MYMAMTRFQVSLGQELLFESAWKKRKSYLGCVNGYRGLYLLRGETEEVHTLYISHFIWNSKDDFDRWTQSDSFVKAHTQFGDISALFASQPVFEGLTVVLQEKSEGK
ncbi:MAG: antibiotic biosynthesis monooxygenase [Methylococcales bacterium]|nr:antibiotic biosynthesis monooxygenase [Methylococcales bacterium]